MADEDAGTKHRGRTENLRPPWQPGQSGNPSGKTNGLSLTRLLRAALESEKVPGVRIPEGRTAADVVVAALIKHATKGNAALIKEAFDRIDGKVAERVEVAQATAADAWAEAEVVADEHRPDEPPEGAPGAAEG